MTILLQGAESTAEKTSNPATVGKRLKDDICELMDRLKSQVTVQTQSLTHIHTVCLSFLLMKLS